MKKRLLNFGLKGKTACRNALCGFCGEERGAAEMVAIIVVVVILIAVAAIFREELIRAVTTAFERLMEFINA